MSKRVINMVVKNILSGFVNREVSRVANKLVKGWLGRLS